MTDYDPRTDTGIPTEPVGSLPRPQKLQDAYAGYDEGRVSKQDLEALQDEAAKESIERYEATGSPIVSDGEQRWSSFATYSDHRHARRHRARGHPRGRTVSTSPSSPTATTASCPSSSRGPFRYKSFASDSLRKSITLRHQADEAGGHRAVDDGAALSRSTTRSTATRARTSSSDLVRRVRQGHPRAFAPGPLTSRSTSPRAGSRPATTRATRGPAGNLLPHFIELNNRVLAEFSADERANIGVHTCPGGDRDSVHCADVDYNDLLPEPARAQRRLLPHAAGQRARQGPRLRIVRRQPPRRRRRCAAAGARRRRQPAEPARRVAQEIRDQLVRAAEFIPKEQLGSTDDCGFSPFSIDEKPNHGSPDYARDVAFQKITNRVEGTRAAAEQLNLG